MIIIEDPTEFLAALSAPEEEWLCCHGCDRFFQLKNSKGEREVRCPFPGCREYGLGLGIFLWDALRVAEDPSWPRSPEELVHGQRAPDPQIFYQQALQVRIDLLILAFEASDESREIGAGPSRYLRPFLKMMSDLCMDLTVVTPCGFCVDLIETVEDLPVWSQTAAQTQAPYMVEELLAFFRFASRTRAVQDAELWLQCLQSIDLVDWFRYTMRNDIRLQAQRDKEKARLHPKRTKRKKRLKR